MCTVTCTQVEKVGVLIELTPGGGVRWGVGLVIGGCVNIDSGSEIDV